MLKMKAVVENSSMPKTVKCTVYNLFSFFFILKSYAEPFWSRIRIKFHFFEVNLNSFLLLRLYISSTLCVVLK